jgi:hypothetical protein
MGLHGYDFRMQASYRKMHVHDAECFDVKKEFLRY